MATCRRPLTPTVVSFWLPTCTLTVVDCAATLATANNAMAHARIVDTGDRIYDCLHGQMYQATPRKACGAVCGADLLVCAGPPGPARPTWTSAAGLESRPTMNVSGPASGTADASLPRWAGGRIRRPRMPPRARSSRRAPDRTTSPARGAR